MKVLIVEPLKAPYVTEIDGTLESMQEVVSGLIQAIYPFEEDPEIALICNDEAKLMGMPLNRPLMDSAGGIYDMIAGTFFLCAAPSDSDDFESLTEAQIRQYTDYYAHPLIIGIP